MPDKELQKDVSTLHNNKKSELKQKAKPIPAEEIIDREGHYDVDGVSFVEGIGVIVASDATVEKILKNKKSK